MTRRALLALAPAFLVAREAKRPHAACTTAPWPDLLEAVKAIKSMGFDGFEARFQDVQAQFPDIEQGRRALHHGGLRLLGVSFESDGLPAEPAVFKTAERAAAVGAERLIFTGSATADALNRAGKHCRTKGLRLAYRASAKAIADVIDQADRSLVHFIVDGGPDLAEFWKANHYRIDGLWIDAGSPLPDSASLKAAIRQKEWAGWIIANGTHEAALRDARAAIRQTFEV